MTAMPTLGNTCVASNCASRSSAQSLSTGSRTMAVYGANCTNRNGKSPCPQAVRQSLIIAGNSVRYSNALGAFDSPWYQIAPRIAYGNKGWIMALYSPLGLWGFVVAGLAASCFKAGVAWSVFVLVHASAGVPP